MKKPLFLWLAFLPFTGLVLTVCNTFGILAPNITMTLTLDKTEARVGDTVTATVVLKNLEHVNIEVELPNWIVNKGGKSKKDILYAVFNFKEDFNWIEELESGSYDHTVVKIPKFIIKKDEEIKRTFKYTITAEEDIVVHARSFFLFSDDEFNDIFYEGKNYYTGIKWSRVPELITIKVQQGGH